MRILMCVSALLLMAGSALAQNTDTTAKFNQEPVQSPVQSGSEALAVPDAMSAAQLQLRADMNAEIEARFTAEQGAVAALVARLEGARSSEDRLALQTRITAVKAQGWRDVLGIQLKYAELGGYTEQAEKLREQVTRLDEGPASAAASTKTANERRTPATAGGVK